MMLRILKISAYIYATLGAIALWMIPASINEWFGVENDPLSAVFALFLALPWTLFLKLLREPSTYLAFMVSAIGIAINSMILFWLGTRSSRKYK